MENLDLDEIMITSKHRDLGILRNKYDSIRDINTDLPR